MLITCKQVTFKLCIPHPINPGGSQPSHHLFNRTSNGHNLLICCTNISFTCFTHLTISTENYPLHPPHRVSSRHVPFSQQLIYARISICTQQSQLSSGKTAIII